MRDLIAAFKKFDDDNPIVWFYFNVFVNEAMSRGKTRSSARLLVERIRWELYIITKSDDEFKINDHTTPYYGRKWLCLNPEHPDFFKLRKIRNDKTMEEWREFFGFPP